MNEKQLRCEHLNFGAKVDVHRLTGEDGKVNGFLADVRIVCVDCDLPFKFVGLPDGLDLCGAARSYGGEEARLAISPDGRPSTATLRGFTVTRTGPGQ